MLGNLVNVFYYIFTTNINKGNNLNDSIVLTGEQIPLARLLAMKAALKMEIIGLTRSKGGSIYSLVKKELGIKGNKGNVLSQLEAHIDEVYHATMVN